MFLDRQALFFKIDVDIFAAPKKLPNCRDWFVWFEKKRLKKAFRQILSIVLKSSKRPFSFGILVKLFLEPFPHETMVDFSTTNLFICTWVFCGTFYRYFNCSGSLSGGGGRNPLSKDERMTLNELANFHMKTFFNSIEASKRFVSHSFIKKLCKFTVRFKENVKSSEDAANLLVQMASDYEMTGGHWILFFNRMDPSRREEAFNILLEGFLPLFYSFHTYTYAATLEHWGPISRFNAKISLDNFIICFVLQEKRVIKNCKIKGNRRTLAVTDHALLKSSNVKAVENDPEPLRLLRIIDEIYSKNPTGLTKKCKNS